MPTSADVEYAERQFDAWLADHDAAVRASIDWRVLARAHAAAAINVGTARAKYETTLRDTTKAEVEDGRSVAGAGVIAAAKAQEHRNRMHEAEAAWRGVKEHLRTVDKDIDKTRSDVVDARQMRAAETYGGGA